MAAPGAPVRIRLPDWGSDLRQALWLRVRYEADDSSVSLFCEEWVDGRLVSSRPAFTTWPGTARSGVVVQDFFCPAPRGEAGTNNALLVSVGTGSAQPLEVGLLLQ